MTNHDLNYWRQLATRYFEAETTEEEETALRRFAASESASRDGIVGYRATTI